MTTFQKAMAALLLLGCLLSLASCGADTSMNDLNAIKDKLTAKGYQAQLVETAEVSIEAQLDASNQSDSISIVLLKDEQSAKHYFEIMKGQMDYYISQNEAEAAYLAHVLNTYRSEMTAEEITKAEENISYFQKCADETRNTICARHGRAVVMATGKAIYEACK